jgi:hypothetical protein
MKDCVGRPLYNGDLVIYSPRTSYAMYMAIVVDATKGTILSGRLQENGGIHINSRTGEANSSRLFTIARRGETDDYENINDDFQDALEKMQIKI